MYEYWDSFDCEIQCEEYYKDYPEFEYVEDSLDDEGLPF